MGKFHIGKNGKIAKCTAKNNCPLGGLHVEANSQEEAQVKMDKELKKENPILAKSETKFPTMESKRLEDYRIWEVSDKHKPILEYIPKEQKTEEVVTAALKAHGKNLLYVQNNVRTSEFYKKAVELNAECFVYVPNKHKTLEMCKNIQKRAREKDKEAQKDYEKEKEEWEKIRKSYKLAEEDSWDNKDYRKLMYSEPQPPEENYYFDKITKAIPKKFKNTNKSNYKPVRVNGGYVLENIPPKDEDIALAQALKQMKPQGL